MQAQVVIKPAVGFNATNISKNDETGKFTARPGYQVGGTVQIGNKVYIEPGLFYMRKSTRYSQEGDNLNNVNYNISGIEVPVTLGAHFLGNANSMFNVRGFAGGSAFIMTRIEDLDLKDFNRAQWGVFAGLGVDLAFLFVDAKYQWSLTNLQKEDLTQINVGKWRGLYINAGVRIPLGAKNTTQKTW